MQCDITQFYQSDCLSSPCKARSPTSRPSKYRTFYKLWKYHTRSSRLNWRPKNVHFGKTHHWDKILYFVYWGIKQASKGSKYDAKWYECGFQAEQLIPCERHLWVGLVSDETSLGDGDRVHAIPTVLTVQLTKWTRNIFPMSWYFHSYVTIFVTTV